MGSPIFEVPSGTIDGVNTVFTVSKPYTPNSTAVWINGTLLERTLDDGWVESDPSTGEITLKEAPRSSGACPDVIQVFYKDTEDDLIGTVVEGIEGTISTTGALSGNLLVTLPITGSVDDTLSISGILVDSTTMLEGSLLPSDFLEGEIAICD